MQVGTKPKGPGGRPRKFDEGQALASIQRQLWTSGLSGVSLDGIARAAGINRPSLAASFGGKDQIYAQAAAQYVAMMDARVSRALEHEDLELALRAAFDVAIDVYTAEGPNGCFVLCTAPAEAQTSEVCRRILDQAVIEIDAVFLRRVEREPARTAAGSPEPSLLAAQLGATLHSLALRARAGWSEDRLRGFTDGAVHLVLAASGTTPAA